MGPEPEKREMNLSGMDLIPKNRPIVKTTRELRLEAALLKVLKIPNRTSGGDWDEIEEARYIASKALEGPNERK